MENGAQTRRDLPSRDGDDARGSWLILAPAKTPDPALAGEGVKNAPSSALVGEGAKNAPSPARGGGLGRGFALAAIAALLFAGCATVPEDLQPVPEIQPEVAEVRSDPEAFAGATVVWGGNIASVDNLAEGTRLEIVSRPLGRDQRPLAVDHSDGRFHAFFPGFLDPQVHTPMREVTIRGQVDGANEDSIGEFPYTFPRVEVESLHLWPVPEPEPRVIYRDPFWDPWGPWGPSWGYPWHRGWW
ncbi:MAG: Slp family lipoprotein [Thioalkalivibrio sp.]|nr:Slp family lipoprotein [Thioalkalivibrio sp.]